MKGKRITYTNAMNSFLSKNRNLCRQELTDRFNAKFGLNLRKATITSKCKRERWLTGRDGKFQKGNVPHPDARPKGPNSTSFKKGSRPHNWVPVGTERIAEGYQEIKVAEPHQWKQKHRILWEQHHGPIQKGIIIRFLDGNPMNCIVENLEAVPRALNGPLNKSGYSSLPPELKPAAKTIVMINSCIRKLKTARG